MRRYDSRQPKSSPNEGLAQSPPSSEKLATKRRKPRSKTPSRWPWRNSILHSENRDERLEALITLQRLGDADVKIELVRLTTRNSDGTYSEPDEKVRTLAQGALASIESRERVVSMVGNVVHGISLASVLLFAALGLAITFGLMGVINMAHGEMLMIGAYVTYTVQTLFERVSLRTSIGTWRLQCPSRSW